MTDSRIPMVLVENRNQQSGHGSCCVLPHIRQGAHVLLKQRAVKQTSRQPLSTKSQRCVRRRMRTGEKINLQPPCRSGSNRETAPPSSVNATDVVHLPGVALAGRSSACYCGHHQTWTTLWFCDPPSPSSQKQPPWAHVTRVAQLRVAANARLTPSDVRAPSTRPMSH